MKRTVIKVQAFLFSCALIVACSKHSSLEEMSFKANQADAIKSIPPNPMPPDSLELDSLDKPGFR